MKCSNCNYNCAALYDINNKSVCDLCLMDELEVRDPTDTRVKITKCPVGYAAGCNDLQPRYVSTYHNGRKPSLDELDRMLNTFIPRVI